jgi:hypothetical protein
MYFQTHFMRRFAVGLLLSVLSSAAPGQNILNNSGFEYGLMCYQNSVWSYSGNFGRGDYRLLLSPDAHSGNYSLEINCGGADCFKAAAISDPIPAYPNQSYILNLYAKCPIGATATVFIPAVATGDLSTPMNCTGYWELNTISFQTSPTAQSFFFYLFSYYGQWARFDDVVLTYGNGTAPTPLTLYPGNRNVTVSNQAVVVDGAPYLALGFFSVDYNDLPTVAAMGANTIFGLGDLSSQANCYNTTQIRYEDRAYQLGLNFVPDSSTTARLAVPSIMPGVMQQFAPHLANIAWMLADEPDQNSVPFWYMDPNVFTAEYSAAKSQTTLPVFADFQHAAWSVASDDAPYAPGVDFFMAEPYGSDFSTSSHAANIFKSFLPLRPIWMAQDDPDADLIVPKAYWLIVNGVTGIAYFDWDTFQTEPNKLAAVQQVFSELGQLKSVIFSQNIAPLVTASPSIGHTARHANGSVYILAVNPIAQNVSATFHIDGLAAGQPIHVMFENRSITASAGGFTDNFAGVARHVYVVNMPIASPPIRGPQRPNVENPRLQPPLSSGHTIEKPRGLIN